MSDIIGGQCGSIGGPGWEVNPAGTEGVCLVVESIGWDLGGPHGALRASNDYAAGLFTGSDEDVVAESLHKAWNRVLARNMAYTEGTIQTILGAVRQSVNHLQQANCDMAAQSIAKISSDDGRVPDGVQP